MYEESGKKLSINWVSLIIKLGILAIIVFLLCWIFTRNKGNSNNYSSRDKEYIANITAMKEAAFEYFTESKLPQNIGGTKTLSLNDMVNQKLLIDFTNNGKDCNLSNSYVQTTKTADGAYALKVNLVCGDTNDFIVTTIEQPKCPNNNCLADNTSDKEEDNNVNPDYLPDENDKYYDDKTDSYVNNNQQNNTSNNNANTNNSTSQNKSPKVVTKVKITISACNTCNNNGTNNNTNNNNENNKPSETPKTKYYRYYRYTDWQNGYSSDANAEVQKCELKTYDYCKINNQTIYTTSYTQNANPHSYSYTLKFTDFTANDIMDGTIKVVPNSEQHFGNSILDYSNYVDMKYNKPNISMVGDTSGKNNSDSTTVDLGKFRESSLKSSNFTFDVSEVYKKNNDYYVDINIHIKNVNGVKAYYDNTLGFSLYYVPLKFNITYVNKNQCITDYEEYSSKYSNGYIAINPQTKTSYRYRLKEFIWSTDANLDGWTFTGKVEYY